MNNQRVDQHINEIEAALIRDDPALASRFRLLDGHDARRDRLVFSLLAASMVLLGYGLSMQAGAAWIAGGVVLVASFAVDEHYERRNGRGRQVGRTNHTEVSPLRRATASQNGSDGTQ